MTYFLQQTINGISVGAIYAMIAVGYSMVYGLLYLINFAHGDLYVMGTFVVYSCLVTFGASGIISPMLSCLAGAIVAGIIGILTERFAYRPIRSGSRNISMVSALGVSAMLKTTSQVIWGPESKAFPSFLPEGKIMLGDIILYERSIWVVVFSVVVIVIMMLITQYTKFGRGTRFIMQDITTASLVGVNVNFIIPTVYALGGFLGTLGGVLYSSYYSLISIDIGILGTIKAWAVVTLGGPGSLVGCLVGGLILGWSEAMASSYLFNAVRDAVGYIVIIVALMIRPYGLFGKKKEEKV